MAKPTALSIGKLGKGNHPVGGGLYLRVIGGSRTFSFRYARQKKTHWVSIGPVADYSLAEARAKARAWRQRLDSGADLSAEVRAARNPASSTAPTFAEVAKRYIASHEAGWKSAKHGKQWQATLDQHAASLSALPVTQIDVDRLWGCLNRFGAPARKQRIGCAGGSKRS